MFVRRWCTLFSLFLLLTMIGVSWSTPAIAQKDLPIIEYAYPDVSVWTTRRDDEGKLKNPLLKVAEQLFAKSDLKWYSADYPAKRMFANLRNGSSNFSMLVNAKSLLQDCCIVGTHPVAVVEIRAFNKQGLAPIISLQDLIGKKVITIRGYSYAGIRKFIHENKKTITNSEAPNHHTAFNMLARGRGDYLIDYTYPALEVLSDYPISNITSSTLKKTNVYLILNKNFPNAETVVHDLEETLKSIDIHQYFTNYVIN